MYLTIEIYYNIAGNIDYGSGPYSVTFSAGTSTASIFLSITDDNITENDETFLLNIDPISLSNILVLGAQRGILVTIEDDDCK